MPALPLTQLVSSPTDSMKRIAIISDTHASLLPDTLPYLQGVDLILHAGDIGSSRVWKELQAIAPTQAVFGNIDDVQMRSCVPEVYTAEEEGVRILMMHIGGYPGKYTPQALELIKTYRPDLFISGHSHILKVMPDPKRSNLLHINPGALALSGWHTVRTIVRLTLSQGSMSHLEVIELPRTPHAY